MLWKLEKGMSLKDYFAGQALAGIIASNQYTKQTPNEIAYIAFQFADAMIKESLSLNIASTIDKKIN